MSTAGELSGRRRRDLLSPGGVYEREDDDWYVEPAWVVRELAWAEIGAPLEPAWDPACGGGNIPRALRQLGIDAVGTDIIDRGYGTGGIDFLGMLPYLPEPTPRAIVTNPPYDKAEAFARRALDLVPYVALLVQAKFLYSQRRYVLFTERPPARIYHLSTRPSMPPGALLRDGKIKAAGGKMDFCWVVWEATSAGAATRTRWLRKSIED